jgi:hypothetical protein
MKKNHVRARCAFTAWAAGKPVTTTDSREIETLASGWEKPYFA